MDSKNQIQKREIKFRAWIPNTGWLAEGFSIAMDGTELYDDNGHSWPVCDLEIMQFTGLHDKNGKEIYADDILFDGEHKFRVYAMYGGFGIKAPHWSGIMEDMVMGDDLIMQPLADAQTMSYISQSMEVIGNIYEHNHLLR